jgi:hypothetical protein
VLFTVTHETVDGNAGTVAQDVSLYEALRQTTGPFEQVDDDDGTVLGCRLRRLRAINSKAPSVFLKPFSLEPTTEPNTRSGAEFLLRSDHKVLIKLVAGIGFEPMTCRL